MIPKIIHYCWFGNGKKTALVNKCIDSWKRFLPDYEIKEWNESNFDVFQNEYVKEAYSQKKWAYVSDFARMKILFENGGIYFDTDVEMIKPLPASFRELDAFSGIESDSLLVNPGLVFGCSKYNRIVGSVLDSYKNAIFVNARVEDMETINIRITNLLSTKGYVLADKFQQIDSLSVFPSPFFCAYDPVERKPNITEQSICFHHYAGSWFSPMRKLKFKIGTIKRRIINFLHER